MLSAAVPLADAGLVLTGALGPGTPGWCVDHAVAGTVLLPGTAFVEMAVRAGDEVGCGTVEELTLRTPLALSRSSTVQVTVGRPDEDGRRPVALHSRTGSADAWTLHAEGLLGDRGLDEPVAGPGDWPPPGARALTTDGLYDELGTRGYDYGPAFQGVRSLWHRDDEVFAEVELTAEAGAPEGYLLHPALLDAALHGVAATGLLPQVPGIRLPFAWSGVRVHASGATALRVLMRRTGPDSVALTAVDGDGEPVVSVASLALLPVAPEALRATSPTEALFALRWEEAGSASGEGPAAASGNGAAAGGGAGAWGAVLTGPQGLGPLDAEGFSPVLLDLGGHADDRDGGESLVLAVLEIVRRFVADAALRERTLVVRTCGAVSVGAGDPVADPGAAAVWGLIRSAQSEHPGRFVLVDSDVEITPAVIGDEPQLALRGGVSYVPRLVRHAGEEGLVAPVLDPGRTVLVTGGTGGLGALVARHLVAAHGVRRLLLVSRSGAAAPGVPELVAELAESGAVADVRACDVGDRQALAALVAEVQASERPLGAVVHAAGVLADATLTGLDAEAVAAVLRPKARAALWLHELTAGLDLSAFVLFSSVAGVLGNPGQANYAAANAFLDALAVHRRELGLPAVSLAWGLWESPSGMTGRLGARELARMRHAGLLPLPVEEALALLDSGLAEAARGGGAAVLVPARIDAGSPVRAGRPVPPLLARLAPAGAKRRRAARAASTAGTGQAFAARLAGLSGAERERLLLEVVRAESALVLGHTDGTRLDVAAEFRKSGLDSLMAVEVRNRLATVTGVTLPATVVFDHPTPRALARFLVGLLTGEDAAPADPASGVVRTADEPVAIIGMACRYPGGVAGPADLWRLVLEEREAVGAFPVDRGWDLAALFDTSAGAHGTSDTRYGGFLDDAAGFDPALFGISPREALAMDPQQRLLLEVSWEALESAGIPAEAVRGSRTGVFAGLMYHGYGSGGAEVPEDVAGYLLTGGAGSVASGRIAYALGLQGPALTVDTACSSSLVALHLAAQSLRRGESDLALAGGVTVMVTPDTFVEFSRQGGLAADGRCKSFGEGADGTGWSEGVGVLLVERLSDALRNGHRVLAVLRGSAVNQDGASNGLTAPNGGAQQRVIREALADAGLTPADVDAVEGHGTGTVLGDPIEAGALLSVYGQDRAQPLYLGSVKSNLGHTQAAAGVAGVIKMVKALDAGVLPRTLHADPPSSHVDWASGGVRLLSERREWPGAGRPRRAAVSSFGISGTNAHIVLEQAPAAAAPPERGPDPAVVPLLLSAADEEALRAQAGRIAGALADGAELVDVAWSSAVNRAALPCRAVVVADGRERAVERLRALADGRASAGALTGRAGEESRLAVVFSGQGSQRLGMGRELYAAQPVFAEAFDEMCGHFGPRLEQPLRDVVFGTDQDLLDRTDHAQAALFAVEVALYRLVEHWGVTPELLIGHSIGEFAAAHVSGVWSPADACALVAARGRLMRAVTADGAMAALEAAEEEVVHELAAYGGRVGVAAVNGPLAVVVSGDREAVERVAERFRGRGRRVRRLRVSHAFHSAHLDGMLDAFADVLARVSFRPPALPVVSNVTGALAGPDELCAPDYWVRHVREAVRFGDGVGTLHAAGATAYLELGPAGVLGGAVRDSLPETASPVIVSALRTDRSEPAAFLSALAALHVSGLRADWSKAFEGTGARTVELPTYPFRHRRFWLSPSRRATPLAEVVRRLDLTAEQTRALDALVDAGERPERLRRLAHRVSWQPVTVGAAGLRERWRVVLPDGADTADPRATALLDALVRAGARATLDPVGEVAGVVVAAALAADPGLFALQAAQTVADGPVWFVTEGAVRADAPEDRGRGVAQAAVWGLGQVVALEHAPVWGGLADLDGFGEQTLDTLCAVLASGGGPGREDQVAVRGGQVLGRRIVPVTAADTRGTGRPWRPTGTVLVTGGTGALGAHVARWLTTLGARRIVLTGRRGPTAPGATELVAELSALEAEVTVEACDTADRPALADVLARHRPTAVFHTAGTFTAQPVTGLSPEAWSAVVAGKADGARHLDELSRELGLELDAFVLFSSIAGVWGATGQASYAAGNALLDALARQRRADGLPATSVAWGPWAGAGMAADEARAGLLRRSGLRPLDPADALTHLERALESDEPCRVVADVDWERLTAVFGAARPGPLFDQVAGRPEQDGAAAGGDFARHLAALPPVERERAVRTLVRDEVAAALGYDAASDLDVTQTFKGLGLDSMTAVDVRGRLAAATGLALPTTVVFDHPTPRDLASALLDRLTGASTQAEAATATATATARGYGPDEPVAIVGMACRYPGGTVTPEDLWRLVVEERDAITDFPADRGWDLAALYDPDPAATGTSYSREGGFLDDIAGFDAGLFAISPREALAMDPHQRLLLETTWEAFERSGIPPSSLRGSNTGVFVGAGEQDYAGGVADAPEGVANHLLLGHTASVLSGRVAYVFGLEGPTLTLDTACSAGLVALHLAVRALRGGECDLAVAGGATVMSTPGGFVEFSRQQVLGRTGRCRSYSDDADGSAFSEGIGTLVVERLSDARRNGHPVLAVVRGTAVNQDGASNGLSAPNGRSQQRVIRQALADAGLAPADVDAVEGHGTGTPLGDPIEAQALLATYGQDRPAERPLYLGSLKSNIGHTQASAGIAGVIKTVQALRHGVLPRTLHLAEASSHVDWSSGRVELLAATREWPQVARARRAAVSAFGISGTNAHVILEQAQEEERGRGEPSAVAPPPESEVPSAASGVPTAAGRAAVAAGPAVLPLSAATPAALRDQAGRLRDTLADRSDPELRAVGRALVTSRETGLEHRATVVAADREEALAALGALADEEAHPQLVTGAAAPGAGPVLVFPGQGSQWPGMAVELLDTSPVFRDALTECDDALGEFVGWSVFDVLHDRPGAPALERLDVVQPLLFAVMVALARTWRAAGVEPAAVIGHSQGEVAAACVAGALPLPDAARIICLRSRTMQEELSGLGAMASVAAPRETVARRLERWDGRLSVAAVNGPASVVVSGEAAAIEEFLVDADAAGLRARRVKGAIAAGHSAQVELVRERVLAELAPVTPGAGTVPIVSTVTGEATDGSAMDAGYWYRNMREPVRFDTAVRILASRGHRVFLEVSPHPVLLTGLQETLEDAGASAVALGTLRRDEGGARRFLSSLGAAYAAGVPVDWTRAVYAEKPAVAVELPTYAFQHRRYWLEAPRQSAYFAAPAGAPAEAGVTDGDEAQRRFWDAVESGDLDGLLGELPLVNGQLASFRDVLPALADWRRRSREDAVLDRWRHRVVWEPVVTPARPVLTGGWLLVVPDDPAARSVADRIGPALGAGVTTLALPTDADRAAVAGALGALPAQAPAFTGVLALTGLLGGTRPDHDAVPRALAATLALDQALGDVDWPAPLWVLTRGAVGAEPADRVPAPEQATVWGLGAVARQEHPERWGGVLDLPTELGDRELARLVAVLSGATGEDEVAVRASAALTRRLVPAAAPDRPEGWKPSGTVLVTGGTGALGGHVARHLAVLGAPHLLLAGRRGPQAPGARELADELTALGARVTLASCDLGDRAELERLLGEVPAEYPLTAVVHAAAAVDDALLTSLTPAQLQRSLRVKAQAALHLDELTRNLPLEAFVLFSSFAGVTADAGQGGYAPGNAYLDALALRRRALGLPALSVGWGHWAGASGLEGGEVIANRLHRFAMESMDPRRAVRALERAVGGDSGHLVVADVDFGRLTTDPAGVRATRLFLGLPGYRRSAPDTDPAGRSAEPDTGAETGVGFRDRVAAAPPGERADLTKNLIMRHLAVVLGHADPGEISPSRLFRELGIDSLTAVEFRNRLGAATGLRLPVGVVFDHPTPEALAAHVLTELAVDDGRAADGAAEHVAGAEAELARLEAALDHLDAPASAAVADRLRALLARLPEGTADAGHDGDADPLASATTAEEVLGFIQERFGR
ncbi:type I polyketide synthase [Streptomyces sp. NPDC013172]|uniref:type I polyketide synthase n=1 Tax=Streptomyces sp. NPDC013172 TaxID=3155009 RepID=UPI0033D84BFF